MTGAVVRLTVTPPGPVTDRVTVEVRGAVHNPGATALRTTLRLELPDGSVETAEVTVPAGGVHCLRARWNTAGSAGMQTFRLTAGEASAERRLEVLPSAQRSTGLIGGAWLGIVHWSEDEAAYWNDTLRQFTEDDWRETLRGMHALGMDLVIVQESWRNHTWYGEHYHQMTAENYRETYAGKAFYPSELWPGRMELPSVDPLEAILDEADRLDMQVMLGVGNYAHFDYTPGSLAWHLDVIEELWARYRQHPSLYGWYIAEEMNGRLKPHEMRYWNRTEAFRGEVLAFFRAMSARRDALAPETLILLAPDSHFHHEAAETWQELVYYCDILCFQGYQRAEADGVPVAENIRRMQGWCDAAGAHMWMDMEAFGFEHPDKVGPQRESYGRLLPDGTEEFVHVPLVPQPMPVLAEELARFPWFEFICAYQYPGLFCASDARLQPGGPAAVRLFEDYRAYARRVRG